MIFDVFRGTARGIGAKFGDIPVITTSARCAGVGAKVGGGSLGSIIAEMAVRMSASTGLVTAASCIASVGADAAAIVGLATVGSMAGGPSAANAIDFRDAPRESPVFARRRVPRPVAYPPILISAAGRMST